MYKLFPDWNTQEEMEKVRWGELEDDVSEESVEMSTPDSEFTDNLYDTQFDNMTIRKLPLCPC